MTDIPEPITAQPLTEAHKKQMADRMQRQPHNPLTDALEAYVQQTSDELKAAKLAAAVASAERNAMERDLAEARKTIDQLRASLDEERKVSARAISASFAGTLGVLDLSGLDRIQIVAEHHSNAPVPVPSGEWICLGRVWRQAEAAGIKVEL
jgi:hypothetical protein